MLVLDQSEYCEKTKVVSAKMKQKDSLRVKLQARKAFGRPCG